MDIAFRIHMHSRKCDKGLVHWPNPKFDVSLMKRTGVSAILVFDVQVSFILHSISLIYSINFRNVRDILNRLSTSYTYRSGTISVEFKQERF